MRRELFLHLSIWFIFFVLVTLVNRFFSLGYWPFWVGGLIGVFLPDLDHLIYVYFVMPHELTSQRVNDLVEKRQIWRSVQLLYETRSERRGLIFHTIFFQIIFLVLTFWMISSSGSLFGRGLALSFALHLSVDQIMDIRVLGSLDNWHKYLPVYIDPSKAKTYWTITFALLCILGFLM